MNILTNLISLLREEAPFFLHLTVEHLLISLSAIVVASLIGVLLGIFISEYRKYAAWLLGAVNVLYTIPSIALLGFFISITGVGNLTALIALILYALLPIIRSTYTGITHINPLIIEAAEAMGSTRWQLLYKIKLPLALPVLMSGIRNMVTMTIALAGIASFVGAGGIDQRPDIINNKERFGDWEIDTIVGAFNKGAIVTLTERTTKMLLMKYLPNGKEAKGLAKAVIDLLICYLFLYL